MEKFEMSIEWNDVESAYYERLRGNETCFSFKQTAILKTVKMDIETHDQYCKRTANFIKSREEHLFNKNLGYPLIIKSCKFS